MLPRPLAVSPQDAVMRRYGDLGIAVSGNAQTTV